MAASLTNDGKFGDAKSSKKNGDALTCTAAFCFDCHAYFVMISGPMNALGKTVEIQGT